MKIVISSGHGLHIRGASGPSPWGLDEVNEARRVVDQVAVVLRGMGVGVTTYHDDVSDDQDENLKRIVDFHNAQPPHDLDASVHFNSATFSGSNQTSNPVGTEVFYESSAGKEHAKKVVDAIAAASGLINRGAKDGNLYFLNHTAEVAVLVEVCFVNSKGDVNIYHAKFDQICTAIAEGLTGQQAGTQPPERPDHPPVTTPPPSSLFKARGRCSWFGGPEDMGVSPSEGLAFIFDIETVPHLFLPYQPEGTTGLARRLNPYVHYVACRFDYNITPKKMLAESGEVALVRNVKTGMELTAIPSDWGPHEAETGRAADLSPSLLEDLGLATDDEVEVIYPAPQL